MYSASREVSSKVAMAIFRAEHFISALSCPRLLCYQMIRTPQQDLRGQVPALLPTEGAGDHERLERELLYPGWDIAPAPFALDNEEFQFLDSKSHGRITLGE
jgi:hypothetical protein